LPLLPLARLAIFTSEEQKLFNSPPVFNSIERKHYFTFPTGILETAGKLESSKKQSFFQQEPPRYLIGKRGEENTFRAIG